MILNRLGNKTKLAPAIQAYFPKHDLYIEPFMGAGGMFFNKPKAKYNFLNDIDDDVYNLFRCVIDNKDELIDLLIKTPITETQFKEWGKGKKEGTKLLNAVRFLILSNYGLYGKPDTLRIGAVNPKKQILEVLDQTMLFLKDTYLFNVDFRFVFGKIDYKSNIERCFCYADPPYLETTNNYSHFFTEKDSDDLFNTLETSNVKWAMSEFDHPFILERSKAGGHHVNYLFNRKNLENIRTEILVTNYQIPQLKMF